MPTIGNIPRPGYVYDTETDTWVPIGVGAHTHSNIPNTLVDAKGDIITATADNVPARLAVGPNGSSIVADSSTATGLSYQGNYAAGKNKIINGDFTINQRGFTSTTTSGTYGFDRWVLQASDGTVTYSAQTFSPGAAPVSGYESTNFARIVTTGQTLASASAGIIQRIESCRTLAGQIVTVSFFARAASGTPGIAVELGQNFGSGGSATVFAALGKFTVSTSWTRYSATVTLPSISGKTIAGGNDRLGLTFWVSAGSDLNSRTDSLGIQSNTFEIWGVQVEAGSVATAFQTATGSIQGELAACQRYYWRNTVGAAAQSFANGLNSNTFFGYFNLQNPVQMRARPTAFEYLGLNCYDGSTNISITPALDTAGVLTNLINYGGTGFVANRPVIIVAAGATSYVALSAEL